MKSITFQKREQTEEREEINKKSELAAMNPSSLGRLTSFCDMWYDKILTTLCSWENSAFDDILDEDFLRKSNRILLLKERTK